MSTILLVDDEPSITSGLAYHLGQESYSLHIAHTGGDALDQLSCGPDLVVLDLMLPDITGYEVCEAIRQLERYTPVLMLTAKDTLEDKVVGLETGADAYLTKPYEPIELVAQVKALLRMVTARRENEIVLGPLTLKPDEKRVLRDGEELDLSQTELELIDLFMRHPNQVFGRNTLLRNVWGYSADVNNRTVDTTIMRLRQKIEADPSSPQLLTTVRGFGYRMNQVESMGV